MGVYEGVKKCRQSKMRSKAVSFASLGRARGYPTRPYFFSVTHCFAASLCLPMKYRFRCAPDKETSSNTWAVLAIIDVEMLDRANCTRHGVQCPMTPPEL